MTQHNPNLSHNRQGKDVILLHGQLSSIWYAIDTSEIIGELFGQRTYQAVVSFQRMVGLPVTGVVDDTTTPAIVSRRESMMSGPQPVQNQAAFPGQDTTLQGQGEPVEDVRGSMPPPPQTPRPSPTPPQSVPGVPQGSSALSTAHAALLQNQTLSDAVNPVLSQRGQFITVVETDLSFSSLVDRLEV